MKTLKIAAVVVVGFLIAAAIWLAGGAKSVLQETGSQPAAVAAVNLISTNGFAILAGASIVDASLSSITGNVGVYPASGTFNALSCAEVTGTFYSSDAAGPLCKVTNGSLLSQAKTDLTAAYTAAANETPATTLAGADNQLGGKTLTSGIYTFSAAATANVIGTLTLDGGGDPNAVFVFQTASTLVTDSGSIVKLVNGARSCNVFWQVGSSATLGTGTTFVGTIMADQSITDAGGSTVDGRLLARVATVTVNNTTITVPTCASSFPGGRNLRTGTINVVKAVVNDNGGTKKVGDFQLFVNGTPVVSGITNAFPAPAAAYTVTEASDPNYAGTFSGDCDSNGQVSLSTGQNKFCIITNNDKGAPIAVAPIPPLIDVVKVPSPLSLPGGPGPVTYTYTLRNIGTVPVTDVTMIGDTCAPIILASGDTDNDQKLDVNETWVYRCSTSLLATHTNTVVATGWANGISAVDVASATVVVGAPIVPPLIHVTKIPSPLALPAGGGMVTYTKRVTNPGTVPLSNVRLTDDKCNPVTYSSGDANGDGKLDPGETWIYTCSTHLAETTTNTVIAEGDANGLTARDIAIATVVVASPSLPNTGLPPEAGN